MFEVREELHAVVAAVALMRCVCRRNLTCIPCRARVLQTEIKSRGVRIRRWRNDPANLPRLVNHVAGVVDVEREPRRSCPGYITDRTQACAGCGEPLAAGKWALFFEVGLPVTKLRLRDGSQAYAQPARPGVDSIGCDELARIESKKSNRICCVVGVGRAKIDGMGVKGQEGIYHDGGAAPYGWTRSPGVIATVPAEQAVRATIVQLAERGLSTYTIAAILNDNGYRTRKGCAWSSMTVWRITTGRLPQWLLKHLKTSGTIEPVAPAPVNIKPERMVDKRGKSHALKETPDTNVA